MTPEYWRYPVRPKLQILGQKFGLLTVIREAPSTGRARWWVRCECGHERVVPAQDIVKCVKTHRSCK